MRRYIKQFGIMKGHPITKRCPKRPPAIRIKAEGSVLGLPSLIFGLSNVKPPYGRKV